MGKLFNIVFRIISSLLGLCMIFMGSVFVLQGLNLAFQTVAGHQSFMAGDNHWVLYGAIIALIGVGQVVWSNTRPKG